MYLATLHIMHNATLLPKNPVLPVCFILHCFISFVVTNEYLATNSGGCLCTNSLCALITAWLDASREAEMFDRYVRE